MAASQTDAHTWVLPFWRRRPSGGHPVREHRVSRGGFPCLAAESEKVAAEPATTWEAGRQTRVCV